MYVPYVKATEPRILLIYTFQKENLKIVKFIPRCVVSPNTLTTSKVKGIIIKKSPNNGKNWQNHPRIATWTQNVAIFPSQKQLQHWCSSNHWRFTSLKTYMDRNIDAFICRKTLHLFKHIHLSYKLAHTWQNNTYMGTLCDIYVL
jgi:hypothetical protein